MAKTKEAKTLADYIAIAISPVLIMALVGSLVFFLVEISYANGEHVGRLRWILFFFVFGAVLIARISMQGEIADRAGMYGLILGGLVWLALILYVDWKNTGAIAPFGWLIDLVLLAVVWWCAHRLTWDCTLIDDTVDASGAGLLQVAGLEKGPGDADPAAGGPVPPEQPSRAEKLPGLAGWWERYRRYREAKRRQPHAPGVWVVHFSLAALPLFGLGQSRIPPDDAGRRRYVFWLMIIYVGSGLGLLLTTSFLGLRRYLRQRKLQMPLTMAGVWLAVGGFLIAAFLIAGALLPRPNAEYRILDEWLASALEPHERQASRHDVLGDEPGKDKGRLGRDKDRADDKKEGGRRDRPAKDQAAGKDGNDRGPGGKDRDKSDKDAPARDKDGSSRRDGAKDRGKDRDQTDKEKKQERANRDGAGKARDDNGRAETGQRQDNPPPTPGPSALAELARQIATILKWVVGIIAALVVFFLLLRSGLRFLANFTHWARRLLAAFQSFWQALADWWNGGSPTEEDEEESAEAIPPRPFAAFRDPFASGDAEGMAPRQLVRYSFEALQAWAWERGLGRQVGETPLEFAERVGEQVPALDDGLRHLANLYAQIAYARSSLTPACRPPLRQFWQLLQDAVERPMSAGVGSV
jgi:hypothetical protein